MFFSIFGKKNYSMLLRALLVLSVVFVFTFSTSLVFTTAFLPLASFADEDDDDDNEEEGEDEEENEDDDDNDNEDGDNEDENEDEEDGDDVAPAVLSANPLSGTYTSIQSVSLASEDSENIYYTTNGTTPACSPVLGTLYESPISVTTTKTITAVGCSEEELTSEVATFAYTIELETTPADLASILDAVFAPAPGASISLTFTLTLSQDLEINTSVSGSKVVLNEATVITRADGLELNAATLTSSETDIGLLTGLAEGQVFEGALQWGIPNITLNFSAPITISIFVGTDLNGQTLSVVRSVDGNIWETDGIVDLTCVVDQGICSFRATKASYYATYTYTPPAPVSNSGGGGGTIWFPALYNPVSTTTPAPEIEVVLPIQPEQSSVAESRILDLSAPVKTAGQIGTKKPTVAKAVTPKVIAKVQPTPEPALSVEPEQKPKPANKKFLSNILSVIVGLFRWPF